VRSFKRKEGASEEAICGLMFSRILVDIEGKVLKRLDSNYNNNKIRTDHHLETCYILKYPELRGGSCGEPWSIRQTAVYSKLQLQAYSSTWIVLNPMYDSSVERRLEHALKGNTELEQLIAQPIRQHILLIQSVFHLWRDYMLHYDNELLSLVPISLRNVPFACIH
jgi:hypothetical protein